VVGRVARRRAFNRFSTKEMKSPLQQVVTESGWIWRGVAFGKL
jgi:hypothetical protein